MLPLPPGGAPHLFLLAAIAALVGGLSAIERKGALQLMLSRPLVLAPVLGWAVGDAQGGLVLGIPLELLFLGGVNLGGSLPDNESLLAGAMTAMVVPAGIAAGTGVDAPLAAIGLALLLPLALFGRRLERASERRNALLMEEALARAAGGDPRAARVNLRGLLLPFGAAAGICALGVLASPLLALARVRCAGAALSALEGAWYAVWAVAAACAIRAIRDPRAPALAAICAVTVVVITLVVRGILVIPAATLSQPARRVSSAALARVFLRSFFLQAAWNPRGMQNLGFADAIAPALDELYPDRAARARATARHLEFFNCHPYLAAAILGGAVRLEERVASGEAPPQSVSSFKSSLGPPFAALGDGFFWLALRPAAALAAAATEPFLGLGCVAVFIVLYNLVHLAARIWLFGVGYARAEGVVEAVARAHMASGTPFLKACGAALAGAIAARGVVDAGIPGRPLQAMLVASLVVVAWAAVPRLGATRAVYIALLLGALLGARLL